jgi:hypothetical protein
MTAFTTVLVTSALLYWGLIQNFNLEDDEALRAMYAIGG